MHNCPIRYFDCYTGSCLFDLNLYVAQLCICWSSSWNLCCHAVACFWNFIFTQLCACCHPFCNLSLNFCWSCLIIIIFCCSISILAGLICEAGCPLWRSEITGCSLVVPELTDLGLMKSGTELDVAGGQQPVVGMSRAD